jgi:GAF domain-containing protein
MFEKLLRQTPKDIAAAKILRDVEHTAFFQISSVISAQKELNTILEVIARESLNCLKANRSTIFLLDQKSGILKIQLTVALNPPDEQVDLLEEKEVAGKALKQKKPLFLREPKEFSDFFKNEERERKVTSLMSIPLSSQDNSLGVLSAILINEDRRFNEKDLQLLSIIANHVSIALEMTRLHKEVHNLKSFRDTYERYLDNILAQLQGLSEEERQREEEHIEKLIKGRIFDEEQPPEGQGEKGGTGADGVACPVEELKINRHQDNGVAERMRVELEDEYLSLTGNLGGGAFILTSNPMELGDQFSMKLHLSDGRDPMEVVCKVIWTNKYGKESKGLRRGMGIKFLNPQPEVQKWIEESIKSDHLQAVGEIMGVAQEFKS